MRSIKVRIRNMLGAVRRSSDSHTLNVGVLSTGGYANAAAQDPFCTGTSCVITKIYDQSGRGNTLLYQGPGGAGGDDTPSSATGQWQTSNMACSPAAAASGTRTSARSPAHTSQRCSKTTARRAWQPERWHVL